MDLDSHRQRIEISILKCLRNKYSTLLELQDFCDNLYHETFAKGLPDQTLDLPNDIRALILDQLRFLDAKNLMCTNKAWADFRFSPKGNQYWFEKFKKTFLDRPPSCKMKYTAKSSRKMKKIPWFFAYFYAKVSCRKKENFKTFLSSHGFEISDEKRFPSIKRVSCAGETLFRLDDPGLKHLRQMAVKLLDTEMLCFQTTFNDFANLIVEATNSIQTSSKSDCKRDFTLALVNCLGLTNDEIRDFTHCNNSTHGALFKKVALTAIKCQLVKDFWSVHTLKKTKHGCHVPH